MHRFDSEPDDFEFLSDEDRARELGIEPAELLQGDDEDISSIPFNQPGPIPDSILQVAQPSAPGWIEIRLADVARTRGVVNAKGRYRGHVSMIALARGTNLAPSTIIPMLRKDATIKGMSFDTISRICHFLKCNPGDILRFHTGPRPKILLPPRGPMAAK